MREQYKRSFDKLQPSKEFKKELLTSMEQKESKKRIRLRRVIPLAAAVVLVLSLAVAVSAAGGWEAVRLWINGEEMDARSYMDKDGNLTVELEDGETGDIRMELNAGGDGAEDCPYAVDFAKENGRSLLYIEKTGETPVAHDITGRLQNGRFQGDVEAFGQTFRIDLTLDGDQIASLAWSIE